MELGSLLLASVRVHLPALGSFLCMEPLLVHVARFQIIIDFFHSLLPTKIGIRAPNLLRYGIGRHSALRCFLRKKCACVISRFAVFPNPSYPTRNVFLALFLTPTFGIDHFRWQGDDLAACASDRQILR